MTEPPADEPLPYPYPTPDEAEETRALRDWFVRRYPTLEARFAYLAKRRREWEDGSARVVRPREVGDDGES